MYRKEKRSWAKHLDFIIADMLCMIGSYVYAYWLRIGFDNPYVVEEYIRMAILLVLIDVFVVFFFEPYTGILRRNKYQELRATISHCTLVFLGQLLYMFATQRSNIFSRKILFAYWIMSMILSFCVRVFLKRQVRKMIVNNKNRSSLILVTTTELIDKTMESLRKMEYTEFAINGIVLIDEDHTGEIMHGVPVIASADDFYDYLKENVVDEVFISGNTIESSEALSDQLLEMGITVHYNLAHESKLLPNRAIEPFGPFVVLTSSMRMATARELLVKRLIDIVGSLVGLLLCGIVFVIFAPIIKAQSPGPVFFSQVRIGRNGRRFKFYKFRSMNVNAEAEKEKLMEQNEMDGIMFKMKDDPRIFPIGKFMRKYSLDELPQFWNVLKGDMSLVGTRPPTEDEFLQYEYWHKARLGYRPGITGMWQVSGRSNIQNFEEIVALDTYYISNWDLWLDLKILCKTVQVVVKARGAE